MSEDFNNFEEEIQNQSIFSEISEEAVADENDEIFTSEKINIPEIKPIEEKVTNKGLRVFCIILVAVILFTGATVSGYFIGKYNAAMPEKGTAPEIQLEGKPDADEIMAASNIYNSVCDSVVGILVYNEKGEMGEASGVVYSEDGYIVTNDHIYSSVPMAKFKVFTNDNKEYDAYFVAGDTRSDLAVLKISDTVSLSKATFGNSDEVISGETVYAIGCPNGYSDSSTITGGMVSVPKTRQAITSNYSSNFIQTDTAIKPGNSGGALVNVYGQVIGVTSSKISSTSYEGVGYAIPSKTVKKIVESLIANGNVKDRAKLGISYVFYNSAMAELNKLSSHGLVVAEVSEESPLFKKLEEGDIITRVNDIPINDDSVILDILEEQKPGDVILLTVEKKSGGVENISVKLLSDTGSSSYVNSNGDITEKLPTNPGDFNFPEGY